MMTEAVISHASAQGRTENDRSGWNLLICIPRKGYKLAICPDLWKEYRKIPVGLAGRVWLNQYAFSVMEPANNPPNGIEEQKVISLGVDCKDARWILLAAQVKSPFITNEKFTDGRRSGQSQAGRHREIVDEVRLRYSVDIWNPPYALRRLKCEG